VLWENEAWGGFAYVYSPRLADGELADEDANDFTGIGGRL